MLFHRMLVGLSKEFSKNFIQISGSNAPFGSHSVGLCSDGSGWAWGRNNWGQLGTNNTVDCSSPVSVVGKN